MTHALRTLVTALLMSGVALAGAAHARTLNGFVLDDATVPPNKIFHGGPPRDGIPSINTPVFVSAEDADFLADDDRVLGLDIDGVQRAYPIAILNWHEIVNDRINGTAVVVSFCPLCGTGVVFRADIDGEERQFGVSGLLYNSDVLLYDRNRESLWSQIKAEAITGPDTGTALQLIPVTHTSWADWWGRHANTVVLSDQTGFGRNYARDPYSGYYTSNHVMFPVSAESKRYHPKENVLGLSHNGSQKAWPFVELAQSGVSPLSDSIGGTPVQVHFDAEHRTAHVTTADGEALPGIVGFWFAWYAFHPETGVYTAPDG
ncbi:MAG: DUF3179 domain-containing protein [Pseudomonadota bacterium]